MSKEDDLFADYPEFDSEWTEEHWVNLLQYLVSRGHISFREIASAALGQLNPSQVGTSVASKRTFQAGFPKRGVWAAVRRWHFEQSGRCADCGTMLQLQADHIETRQDLGDAADQLTNLTLRCRRCNVVRRPSHKKGGLTFLTTESALMWILFTRRPTTYQEYEGLCRAYGLTMSSIRFQEAWARARWLAKEGQYTISPDSLL